jgi:hypothetical protein
MDCNTAASSSALTYPTRCSRCSASLIEDDTSTQRSSRSTEETCSAVADSDVVSFDNGSIAVAEANAPIAKMPADLVTRSAAPGLLRHRDFCAISGRRST